MPRARPLPSTVRLLTAALLAATATGCSALTPIPPSSPPPALEAVRTEHRHEVYFGTDLAEPDASELARLEAFLAQLPSGAGPRLRLIGRADERASDTYNLELSAKRADAVRRHIRTRLGVEASVATSALGERAPVADGSDERSWSRNRSVEIVATSHLVRLPECPDWSRDPAFDPRNLPLSNLGCANAVNLGLMIAEPGDLEVGRQLGPADGTREAEAVVRYRADKVKSLDKQTVAK